jgi:ubiquitin-like-conjugating enzyme ATG3
MKSFIERMNNSVVAQQLAQRKLPPSPAAKDGKKKWLFGRKTSGSGNAPTGDDEDVDGLRVDFYLVVFLKFVASIVPTIEVDSTTAF